MKLLTLFSFVALTATPAFSRSGIGIPGDDMCENIGQNAAWIMISRQDGQSPSELLEEPDNESSIVHNAMVLAAFETPRYSSEEVIERSIEDFRSRFELECYSKGFFPFVESYTKAGY